MSAEDVAEAAKIKAILMVPNPDTGYELPEATCELLATHVVVGEMLKVADVHFDRPDELIASLRDAWKDKYKKEMPSTYEVRIKTWALGDAAAAPLGGGGGGPIATSVSGGTFESSEHVATARTVVEKMGDAVEPERKEAIIEALAAQRFTTGAQLTQFAFGMYMGRVVSASAVKDVAIGDDPALSDMLKVARKADRNTLPKIIAAKDKKMLKAHFINYQRDLAAKKYAHESSIVSEFAAQLFEVLGDDSTRIFEYMEQYLEKHVGLGMPVALDQPLVVRLMGSQGGVSKADLKDLVEKLEKKLEEKLKAKTEAFDARIKKAEAESTRLKAELKKVADDDDEPGASAKNKKKGKCYKCGKKGHNADECPQNDKAGADEEK